MSRQMSNQSERVLPIESWSDLQKYLSINPKARQKGLKKYEKEFLARYKKHQKPKHKKKTSKPLELGDLGRFSFREHTIVKREELSAERDEYEQKYLHRRVKTRNSKTKTSIPLRQIEDLGRFSFREHTIVKREELSAERDEYEQKYLHRRVKTRNSKTKTSKPLELGDLGRFSFREHTIAKREEYLAERDEYEQKYLHRRVKTRNSKTKTSIPLRQIEDLGRFSFREHTIAKREEYLAERKDYEQKYIHRCVKTRNSKPKRSPSKKLDIDLISGRLNLSEHVDKKRKELSAERDEYEKKYLAKYKESKSILKKSKHLSESNDDLGRLNFRKHVVTKREKLAAERDEYEKKYLARYKKQQKTKRTKKK